MITSLVTENKKLYLILYKEISSDGEVLKNLFKTLSQNDIMFSSLSVQGKLNKISFEIVNDQIDIKV